MKMRSSGLFGVFLLFLLDFWRPTEGLCNLENGTTATCHFLKDIQGIKTQDLETLTTSASERILNPASLQNLTALRHLDLSKGNLVEISDSSFLQLPQLLYLNLAGNRIKHLNSSSLEGLKNLRFLSLKKNNFRYLPEALLDLKNLKTLDVSRNHIVCNCATLKIRDKLVERGVQISKKTLCSGPAGMKGISLLKPSSDLVCIFEEQDEEMQKDRPDIEDIFDLGSGEVEATDDDEYYDENMYTSPESSETPAPETPAPSVTTESETPVSKPTEPTKSEETAEPETPITESTADNTHLTTMAQEASTKSTEVSLENTKLNSDEGIFFANESSTENPPAPQTEKIEKSDVIPVEGSGDDDEFEGSGTIVPPIDFGKPREESAFVGVKTDEDTSSTANLFDFIFGKWDDQPTTATSSEKISEIEKEEFMPVVPSKASEAEGMLTKAIPVELPKPDVDKTVINNEIPTSDGETKQELANASSQDTQTGSGPMIVLIVLLGIFAALLGLAAYKGDFCKKKRIVDDVERGTELKEMRKSLLEGGNSTQPKLSNGNAENVPLIKVPLQTDVKENPRHKNGTVDNSTNFDQESTPPNVEPLDPVKPPRKSIPQEEVRPPTNGKSHPSPRINPEHFKPTSLNLTQNEIKAPPNTPMNEFGSPPLSPDAQRVKIILQENPDSVPKTPILITRTKIGENLVKTP